MNWSDYWPVLLHFGSLSLMAVGGAISALPEMHRFLVDEHAYLSEDQFVNSVALGQIAPGPNVMFVALMGWNIALQAQVGTAVGVQGWLAALPFALTCLACVLLPSSLLTYQITQWLHRERERLGVRAFKSGMAPIVIGLMTSTGWLMQVRHDHFPQDIGLWVLMSATVVAVLKTRIHLLWLLAIGAALGILGWV
jgi:chromate transporter